MNSMFTTIIALLFPFTLLASAEPSQLYTNTYDAWLGDFSESRVSFFKKGTDVISFNWETKNETVYNCGLTPNKFFIAKISRTDEVYLLTQQDAPYYKRDGWVLDRTGNCFSASSLTKSFLPTDGFDYDVWDSVYYSDESKLLSIATSDYGKYTVIVDPKDKKIVSFNDTRFVPGIHPREHEGKAYRSRTRKIGSSYAYSLQIYDTKNFRLERSVDLGPIYISEIYFHQSVQLKLNNEYLISAADGSGQTFIGTYNKATHTVTKKFNNPCYGPEIYVQLNMIACYDTPPGGPWSFYLQDLASGKLKEIWPNLWHEPLLSVKNNLVVSNMQNGRFEVYDLKTEKLTKYYKASTERMFFDKSEENIISVSDNWSGIITVSKFSIKNSESAEVLYKIQVDDNDRFGVVKFDPATNKLFIPIVDKGAYYLDIK